MFYLYGVKHETGKKRKELRANTTKMKKSIFGKPVDFKWVGGKIADTLNQDTALNALKEPLYDELNISHQKEFDEGSWTGSYRNIKRSGVIKIRPYGLRLYGSPVCVIIISTPSTEWTKDPSLTFPPPHVFKAYEKIAKHIRENVHYH